MAADDSGGRNPSSNNKRGRSATAAAAAVVAGSCSSASSSYSGGGGSKWGTDRMVEIELDAARALADLAHSAVIESESTTTNGGESDRKWGNKGRRSAAKRVKAESPLSHLVENTTNGNNNNHSECVKLPSVQDHKVDANDKSHIRVCENAIISTVKAEAEHDTQIPISRPLSIVGGRPKSQLTEAEKEAKRLRRILANRESARQTIRRRQAMCEELTRRAAHLEMENENLKRDKELAVQEYQLLKERNQQLNAQMARKMKTETEVPVEAPAIQANIPTSEKPPLLVYNRPVFAPFVWPSMIQSLNPAQTQPTAQSAASQNHMETTCTPNPSNEKNNPLGVNGPRPPFYLVPCPWFFPFPEPGNGLFTQPPDSNVSRDNQCENSSDTLNEIGSSSQATMVDENQPSLEHNQPPLAFKVKTESSSPKQTNPATNLHDISTRPLSGENNALVHHSKSVLPSKVDAAAAAQARRRRKELTRLKNLNGRQLHLRCNLFYRCRQGWQFCPMDCPRTCEMDCAACKPVCSAVCQDPRFVVGDGIAFYFHGKKDHDFCLVSDENLHVNAHFIGKKNPHMKRDFTWFSTHRRLVIGDRHCQSILMFSVTLLRSVNCIPQSVSFREAQHDGQQISLVSDEGAKWQPANMPHIMLTRTTDTNGVTVRSLEV